MVGPSSCAVGAGDINGDGRSDLAVAIAGDELVQPWLAQPDGTLAASTEQFRAGSPLALTVADVDGTGRADIFVAIAGRRSSAVWLDPVAPVARLPSDLSGLTTPGEAAIADLDGDGRLDIAIPNQGATTLFIGFQDAAQTFNGTNMPIGFSIAGVAAVDVSGDGRPELLLAGASGIARLDNLGGGRFATGTPLTLEGSTQVVAGRFDSDARTDVAFTVDGGVVVLSGLPDGGFGPPTRHALQGGPWRRLRAADLDRDGDTDLLVAGGPGAVRAGRLWPLIANSGRLSPAPAAYVLVGDGRSMVAADLDHDGKLDAAVGQYGVVQLIPGLGGGRFDAPLALPIAPGISRAVAGRFDSDGRADLLALRLGPDGGHHLSMAAGTLDGLAPARELPLGTRVGAMVQTDLNGDGRDEALVTEPLLDRIQRVDFDATGTPSLGTTWSTGSGPSELLVLDVDGDGRDDLLTTDTFSKRIQIRWGDVGGAFATTQTLGTDISTGLLAGDFDGDGRTDLYVTTFTPPYRAVFRQTAARTFGRVNPSLSTPFTPRAAADLDRDRKTDLLGTVTVSGQTQPAIVGVELNPDGGFSPLRTYVASTPVLDVLVARDIDGDGRIDLAGCGRGIAGGPGHIVRFPGRTDGGFTLLPVEETAGDVVDVAAGSFRSTPELFGVFSDRAETLPSTCP